MRKIFIILIYLFPLFVNAQIKGLVQEKAENGNLPIAGANVYWLNTNIGTTTNAKGEFEISYPETFPSKLVVSFVGYQSDTILVETNKFIVVTLKPSITLKAVEIEVRESATKISTISSVNMEIMTNKELKKAACCNLSESFESNATVDVNYTDAVSGAKQIRMLGLDGVYTQILSENMPGIRGIGSQYGLSFVPGTWIESIQITKGVGSVVNGYESISGQINVELLKPEKADKLFLNLYAGDWGRYEANIHSGTQLNKKWSTLLLGHASVVSKKNDNNKDGFLDMPLGNQINLVNRWKYENDDFMAQFGIRAMLDDKQGGQTSYNKTSDFGTTNAYGIGIQNKQLEFFTKTAFGFEGKPYKSLGIITNTKLNQLNSYYGLRMYDGEQQTFYANLIYQSIIVHTEHKFKVGLSYINDTYNESFTGVNYRRNESVPGAFAEYNFDRENKFSFLGGIRVDYHNLFGLQVNPRVHIKYKPHQYTTLRLSGGRGMRVANVFADNSGLMASSRAFIVRNALLPEIAWNYGTTLIRQIKIGSKCFFLTLDYYRTDFQNQVVIDLDADIHSVSFYNLKGLSYSNAAQAELAFEPIKRFEIKTAYKFQDVKTTYGTQLLDKPLVVRNRALINLAYATKFDKWKFDFTAKWFGKARIPPRASKHVLHINDGGSFSTPYYTLNAQITRAFKHFEIYAGGENINNFMQHDAILFANDPFGPHFDAAIIWGPVMGRVLYAGLRLVIK
jgi:outer membrane receptor for ferrienterochelin and colicin